MMGTMFFFCGCVVFDKFPYLEILSEMRELCLLLTLRKLFLQQLFNTHLLEEQLTGKTENIFIPKPIIYYCTKTTTKTYL